jgi:hypothetical protein
MTDPKAVTTTEYLPVKLDSYRVQALQNTLVAEGLEEERLTLHLKQVNKSVKLLIEETQKKQSDSRHALHQGFEMQEVAIAHKVLDSKMVTYRLDTGAVVRERTLTVEEVKHFDSE